MLRSFFAFGLVNFSGFVLAFALWAAGTLIRWMDFGFREIAAILPLMGVFVRFPYSAVDYRLRPYAPRDAPNPADIAFTLTAIFVLVSLVAFVCGQILRHALRQTIMTQ